MTDAESAGWSVRRPAVDEEALFAAIDDLESLGARATDLEEKPGSGGVAYGWFETEPPLRPGDDRRPLPAAERFPNAGDRLPITLEGYTVGGLHHPADLRIDAAGAFGHGLHPTTQMMVALTRREVLRGGSVSVLDVGTGSGVLALAALQAGASRAVGVDVAPASRASAEDNAARNGCGPGSGSPFHFEPGGLAAARRTGTYPLVLANIRGPVLRSLAADLSAVAAGRLLLSGLRFHEEDKALETFRQRGLRLLGRAFLDGWWALALERLDAPPC